MPEPLILPIISVVAAIVSAGVALVQLADIFGKKKPALLDIISSMMGGTGSFPVFDGKDYETWSHMMKPLLESYDLWGLVEKGYRAKAFRKGRKKKDSLAMAIILLAVDNSVRSCTLNAKTSKEVWDAIQNRYHHSSRFVAFVDE